MMRVRAVVRNVALLCLAVAAGWWMKGAGTVYAQHSGGSSPGNLAFQLVGQGPQQSLTVYSPDNRTLYVYSHINEGDSHISCSSSFTIERLGGPIDRQNCAVGDLVR